LKFYPEESGLSGQLFVATGNHVTQYCQLVHGRVAGD